MTKNLILLHGFCETKEMWAHYENELSKEYNVFCLDLPGFGNFHFEVSEITIEDIAHIIQNEINKLQLDDYIIVGHSLGGYIGLEILKYFPHKLKGLGLINSTVFADSSERREKRNDVIRFIKKHSVKVFAKSFIPQLFNQPKREECKQDIDNILSHAINCSEKTLIEYTKAMQSRNDNSQLIKDVNIPILYIIGRQDQTILIKDSLSQVIFPKNSFIQILDNCGHMGIFEHKMKTIRQVSDFIIQCYIK